MKENLFTYKTALAAFFTALGTFLGWKGIMLLCWTGAMTLDYVSGSIAACRQGQWSSAAAREGLWHKAGMIFAVMAAAMGDLTLVVTARFVPLGLSWPGLLLPMVLAWYILTELGSILENAVKLGARVPGWLVKLLREGTRLVESGGTDGIWNQDSRKEELP